MARSTIETGWKLCGGLVLAAFLWAAPAAAQFISYHAVNTSTGQPINPGILPATEPLMVSVSTTANVDLFVDNVPGGGVTSTSDVCNTGGATPGTEICAIHLILNAVGMTIDGFSSPAGAVTTTTNPTSPSGGTSLEIFAGSSSGLLGPTSSAVGPLYVGQVTVTATAANAYLEIMGGEWLGSVLGPTPNSVPSSVLAQSELTCGDGVLDQPPEECDDNNTSSQDGCFSNCELELGMQVVTSPTASGGDITFNFDETRDPVTWAFTPIVISTDAGKNAALSVDTLVSALNANATAIANGLVFEEDTDQSDVIRTNASAFLQDITDTDGTLEIRFVPEPGAWLQLGACLGGLALLARLRRRR